VEELGRRMWVPEPTMITSTKPGLLNDPVRFAVFRHLQETIVAKADAARMRTRLVFTNSSLSLFESPCTGLPLHTIKVASRKTNTRFSCNKRSRFRVQSTVWWSPSNGLPYKRAFYFFIRLSSSLSVSTVRKLRILLLLQKYLVENVWNGFN
jgi:hypothetical protein